MDQPIERVNAQVRILPPKRQNDSRSSRRFVVDGQARPPAEEEHPEAHSEDLPVGHRPQDEAGARLDLTA